MASVTRRFTLWFTLWLPCASMRFAAFACAFGIATATAAERGKLLEACHRGRLEVCHEMLARPRLAAGTRAAIELHLDEIDVKRRACADGDTKVCDDLAREHPDLPPP